METQVINPIARSPTLEIVLMVERAIEESSRELKKNRIMEKIT